MACPVPQPVRFLLDLPGYQLRRDGRSMHLERQPMDLLILLVERRGELITRDDIAARLWGKNVFVESDQSINRAIHKLRVAFADDPENPRYLETVVGKGYRFIGNIDVISSAPNTTPTSITAVEQSALPERGGHRGVWIGVGLALFAVALSVVGLRVWHSWGNAPNIQSIAVLPLQNLSGDANQDYFADGITDELTTDLAKISALRVISRTSAMHYRGSQASLREIAKALKVDAVVEGSVVRSGTRFRITVQLIDAKTDRHLWADSFERELRDLLTTQNTVALDIAHQIRVHLTTLEQAHLERYKSVDAAAYDAYLMGRYTQTSQSPQQLKEGVIAFQQAIERDPTFAPAYAGMADSLSLLVNYGVLSPREAFPKSAAAAAKALELDSSLAEAHTALAYTKQHYEWDWATAEREYKTAISCNPNLATTHLRYAELLSNLGRHDQALAEIRLAQQLDPLSLIYASNLGRFLYYAHQYDAAVAVLARVLSLDPQRVYSRIYLAMTYEEKHMYAEALSEFQKADVEFGATPGVGVAHLYAVSGRRAEARRMLKGLVRDARDSDWVLIAGVYAALGDKDQAFACLQQAYARHDFFLTFVKVDPHMDPLRSDPRFVHLLQRLGLS